MAIARAMSAKFKAFSFPVIKSYSVVPVFRSSVIPRFPVSLKPRGDTWKMNSFTPLTLFAWLHAQVRPSDNYACCIEK